MAIGLPLLLLLPFVVLGSLAAVVFGITYAIIHRKPKAALVALLAPVVLVAGVGMLAALLVFKSHRVAWVDQPGYVTLVSGTAAPRVVAVPPSPAMPAMPAMPALPPAPPMTVHAEPAMWLIVAVVVLIGVLLAKLIRRQSTCGEGTRGGWGRLAVFATLILLATVALVRHTAETHARAERQRAEAIQRHDEEMRRAVEEAQRKGVDAQRKAAEAQAAASRLLEGGSIQKMWEQLNEPRIKLDDNTLTTSPTADSSAKDAQATSVATNESLARSVARLERMVKRVSEVADQVSDAGTLMGRALVALSERLDAGQRPSAAVITQTTIDAPAVALIAEAKAPAPAEKQVAITVSPPPATPASAVPHHGVESTVEIRVDRNKLAQSGVTFEQLKLALSRGGFWRGTAVRFDPDNFVISATGQFEDGYLPKMTNTLLVPQGPQGQPVYLGNVAEVEDFRAATNADGSSDGQSPPTWIDDPPQRFGSIWREVVVTDEYATAGECARAADVLLLLKTYEHFSQLLGNPRTEESLPSLSFDTKTGTIFANGVVIFEPRGEYGVWLDSRLNTLSNMGIGIDFVRREVVPQHREYYQTEERSFGPMKKLYTMLEFSPSVDAELMRRWGDLCRQDRFAMVGVGAGSVLGLIGLAFGLLKVDTWTKGYYTKRLFLGVPAAIIALIALLGLAAG